jgi:RHS repeat-associated protein
VDLDGDGAFSGSGEIDDTGTFNDANEWLTRDTDTNSSVNYTLAHDAVGNMTDDGKDYTYKYDAFGRLIEVRSKAGGTPLVAEYRYNGLGYRIGWHYDADADGSVESGSPGDDPWYWFAYDEKWRVVATFRYTDAIDKARELFVWHAAGLDGSGGSSYIDSVAMRDRNIDDGWRAAPNDTVMEERVYILQNWRADVSVIVDASGNVLERVKYSAYGVPMCIAFADYNGDSLVDGNDYTDFVADYSAPNTRADVDFDGDVDINDYNLFNTAYDSGNGEAGGRAVLSRASVANRIGYAGYQWDPSITGSGSNAGKYHVRHRVLNAELGRWTRRDPLGYVDGVDLYEFVTGNPLAAHDDTGLFIVFPVINGPTILLINAASRIACCTWAVDEASNNQAWLSQLPNCPCTLGPGNTRPPGEEGKWFKPKDERATHPGSSVCMRSRPRGRLSSGQQCCYTDSGDLITDGPGAGTPDKYAPVGLTSITLHFTADVWPWLECSAGNCLAAYLNARPPNDGNDCPRKSSGDVPACWCS